MGNYNPHTKPVWMMLMPAVIGIAVVIGLLVFIAMGVQELNKFMDDLSTVEGQAIGC